MNDATHQAAVALLKNLAKKNRIKKVEGFYCEFMRALAETIDPKEWAVPESKYEHLFQESADCDMALPTGFFFDIESISTKSRGKKINGHWIALCEKWETDTDTHFIHEMTNEYAFWRMRWPECIDDNAEFEQGAIYIFESDNDKKDVEGDDWTAEDIKKMMTEKGFEYKEGLCKLYRELAPKIRKDYRLPEPMKGSWMP